MKTTRALQPLHPWVEERAPHGCLNTAGLVRQMFIYKLGDALLDVRSMDLRVLGLGYIQDGHLGRRGSSKCDLSVVQREGPRVVLASWAVTVSRGKDPHDAGASETHRACISQCNAAGTDTGSRDIRATAGGPCHHSPRLREPRCGKGLLKV